MSLVVQKFGGTSMADIDCIRQVAKRVIASQSKGYQLVVVVSAMGGETNRLLRLAQVFKGDQHFRELDALLATGEQVSSTLLAMELNRAECPAISFNAYQAGINTNQDFGNAKIEHINDKHIREQLALGNVVVIAGFQGVELQGNITTLGRGGSDTTAVALAAALKADECQIFTDVDGVYSCDPKLVPVAHKLEQITPKEMLELASVGAKVLQTRAVEFASKYHIPLRVLSTFDDGDGTLIFDRGLALDSPSVSGIAYTEHQTRLRLIGLEDKPGLAATILKTFSKHNIALDMLAHHSNQMSSNEEKLTDFTFTLTDKDSGNFSSIIKELESEIGQSIRFNQDKGLAKVSVVGVGLRANTEIAENLFSAMAGQNINIEAIVTAESRITVLIAQEKLRLAVQRLHSCLGLDVE